MCASKMVNLVCMVINGGLDLIMKTYVNLTKSVDDENEAKARSYIFFILSLREQYSLNKCEYSYTFLLQNDLILITYVF